MFKDFHLTFSDECSEYIKRNYPKHKVILEYGSGGSTLLAAESGSTIITTETDSKWLVELMGAYMERRLPGTIIPILSDVGQTKEWGYPTDDTSFKKWASYAQQPWDYLSEHDLQPDLILIDGRFRVASFLTACVNIKKTTLVYFDDYVERDYYHSIEEIFQPVDIIDNRMAIFKLKPRKINANFLLMNFKYFLDPR